MTSGKLFIQEPESTTNPKPKVRLSAEDGELLDGGENTSSAVSPVFGFYSYPGMVLIFVRSPKYPKPKSNGAT